MSALTKQNLEKKKKSGGWPAGQVGQLVTGRAENASPFFLAGRAGPARIDNPNLGSHSLQSANTTQHKASTRSFFFEFDFEKRKNL